MLFPLLPSVRLTTSTAPRPLSIYRYCLKNRCNTVGEPKTCHLRRYEEDSCKGVAWTSRRIGLCLGGARTIGTHKPRSSGKGVMCKRWDTPIKEPLGGINLSLLIHWHSLSLIAEHFQIFPELYICISVYILMFLQNLLILL